MVGFKIIVDCKNWCIYIYTASYVYQEHEGTTNVTLQAWDNVNTSLNCQFVFLLLLLSNCILVDVCTAVGTSYQQGG